MLIVALTQVVPLVLLAISDAPEEIDFSGLGKMMLGGFLVAVAVAIAITFVRLRIRDKKPATNFVSISQPQKKS